MLWGSVGLGYTTSGRVLPTPVGPCQRRADYIEQEKARRQASGRVSMPTLMESINMPSSDLILFTPGPVRIPPIVAEYLGNPPCNYHRQEAFCAMFAETEGDLKGLLGIREPSAYFATTLTCTGTGANEACLYALAGLGKGVILANGFFAARIVDQARQAGLDHVVFDAAHDHPLDPDDVASFLSKHPDVKWAFFVSHETRTGLANPMVDLGRTLKQRGLMVAADVVSSSYAYPIDLEAAQLDLAVASSAKALMAAPGIGIVLVRVDSARALVARRRPGSYYLDVLAEFARQRDTMQPRFAQPVVLHAAMRAACIHLKRVGIENHMQRIRRQLDSLAASLASLGVERLLEPAYSGGIAVNFRLPAHMPYAAFSQNMQKRGYFLLYGIPGDQSHFQVSTIGDLTDQHIAGIQHAFSEVFAR